MTTSLEGKSAFPENHPLSLGSGGRSLPKAVHQFLQESDVIFGVGCSFSTTNYGITFPKGKVIIHSTLDAARPQQGRARRPSRSSATRGSCWRR